MTKKIIFDRYYCINTALIMVHFNSLVTYIEAFIGMLVLGRVQLLITSTCFALSMVTMINK